MGKGLRPSSRVADRGQRHVLEMSTAEEVVTFREGAGVASCFGPRGLSHHQDYRAEKCTDIKVSACEEHTRVVSSCDTQEASNTVQEASPATLDEFGMHVEARKLAKILTPSTVLVWISGAWSGHAVSCESISAGAARPRNHTNDTPNVDRWETLDRRRKQDRKVDGNSETHRAAVNKAAGGAQNTGERATPVVEEVPDALDSLGKEVKYAKKSKEQFPGARKELEPSTQKAAIAHERRKLAAEAIPAARPALVDLGLRRRKQQTIEDAKENPSALHTKVLESETMLNRVSKLGVVTVTSRFAVPWNIRAQWSCLGFICVLARTASASDEVIVDGYWSKRVSGTTTDMAETTGSTFTFEANAGAEGAIAGMMLVWRVAMSRAPESGESRGVCVSNWRVLSAHRWVRQRTSHNRSTPQVTDHGLQSEHKRCSMQR